MSAGYAANVSVPAEPCLRSPAMTLRGAFPDTFELVPLSGVELLDGWVEADLAVPAERCFHGVFWRRLDDESYESFFLRPHQVGNPDAIQYTPVSHGISSWQLYHGDGFWNAVRFPLGETFTLRVAFAGDRAEAFLAGVLALSMRLRREPAAGGVGLIVGGPGLRVEDVRHGSDVELRSEPPPLVEVPGAIRSWEVSDPFPEGEPPAQPCWTALEAEPSGLLDVSRLTGIRDGRDTVLARTTIRSEGVRRVPLELGYSDRAVVHLNGEPLWRGDATYRVRDYRFLGSIGWHDTVWLPLRAGDNELAVAVSETFGGWGLQARYA
jgi:hypothetical protein